MGCELCGSLIGMMFSETEVKPGVWKLICWECKHKMTRTKEVISEKRI